MCPESRDHSKILVFRCLFYASKVTFLWNQKTLDQCWQYRKWIQSNHVLRICFSLWFFMCIFRFSSIFIDIQFIHSWVPISSFTLDSSCSDKEIWLDFSSHFFFKFQGFEGLFPCCRRHHLHQRSQAKTRRRVSQYILRNIPLCSFFNDFCQFSI